MNKQMTLYYIEVYLNSSLHGIYVGVGSKYNIKIKGELKALRNNRHSCNDLQQVYNQLGINALKFVSKETCYQENYVQRKAYHCATLMRKGIRVYNTNIPGLK